MSKKRIFIKINYSNNFIHICNRKKKDEKVDQYFIYIYLEFRAFYNSTSFSAYELRVLYIKKYNFFKQSLKYNIKSGI